MLFVLSIVAMVLAVSCEVPLVLCKSIEADQNNAGVDPTSGGITCLYHRAAMHFPRGMRTVVLARVPRTCTCRAATVVCCTHFYSLVPRLC